jgi:hypothetical protein
MEAVGPVMKALVVALFAGYQLYLVIQRQKALELPSQIQRL